MNATPLLGHSIYLELPVLIVLVSLVYSATRFDSWDRIFREAFHWGLRMTLFLVGIVLILSGVALDDHSMLVRSLLSGAGIVLEVALLFIK
jgi:hypothetical protein